MTVPSVTLNNGMRLPQLGLGVWQVPPEEVAEAVSAAVDAGYRSIDTAASYGNEKEVGEALRRSGLNRGDVFITTKLANPDHGYDTTLRAFDASLRRLGVEAVDLYLIHWPLPDQDRYVSTWKALERIYAEGRARAIGVSNFHVPQLERIMEEGGIIPMVNQVELHPMLAQKELRRFHAAHGIVTEAWSPLGHGRLLDHPTVVDIAQETGRTPAQVLLRWNVRLGNMVIPKSVTPARIRANFEIFDFELSDSQTERLDALNSGTRFGPDPEEFRG